jgi:hypothetical protein
VTFPGGVVPLAAGDLVASGAGGTSGLVSGLADFNGDGKMDLYSVSGFTQGLVVSLNTTTGHTVSFSGPFGFNTSSLTHSSAAVGDIDGDGKPDIVVGNVDINTFSLFLNTSSGGGVSFAAFQDLFEDGCVSDTAYYRWGGAASIPFSNDDFIEYYPNPVTNYLVVSELVQGQPILLDLTLMDAAGHILLTVRQTTGGVIDVGTFAPGVLLLRVQGSGVDKTVKVLKVK